MANHVAWSKKLEPSIKLDLRSSNGQPSAMNELKLTGLKADKQIDVLNIYGDIGGNTDGSV